MKVKEHRDGELENPEEVYIGATLRSDYTEWTFQVEFGEDDRQYGKTTKPIENWVEQAAEANVGTIIDTDCYRSG